MAAITATMVSAPGSCGKTWAAVAIEMGASKNTAQRALAALTRAGLLAPEHTRAGDGTFRPTRYRLRLPTDVLDPVPPRPTRRPSHAPSTDAPAEPTQLSLLGT